MNANKRSTKILNEIKKKTIMKKKDLTGNQDVTNEVEEVNNFCALIVLRLSKKYDLQFVYLILKQSSTQSSIEINSSEM